jgi:hypothetical protein
MSKTTSFHPVFFFIFFLTLALLLFSCTANQPPVVHVDSIPGFWKGLWHGFIAPVTFIISLFSDHIRIYAFPNGGGWYDFGFMLGISGFTGGIFRGARKRRRK